MKRLLDASFEIEKAVHRLLVRKVYHRLKADGTPVSNIDIAIQSAITAVIRDRHEGDNVIGEEGDVSYSENNPYSWVIDPIDGTDNFIKGKKEFGISVGVMNGCHFEEALMLFPSLGEKYYASKGEGVWKDGRRMPRGIDGTAGYGKNIILCSKTYLRLKNVFEVAGYKVDYYKCATYSLLMLLKGMACAYHTINTKIYDVGPMAFLISECGIQSLGRQREKLECYDGPAPIPFFLAIGTGKDPDEIYELIIRGSKAYLA